MVSVTVTMVSVTVTMVSVTVTAVTVTVVSVTVTAVTVTMVSVTVTAVTNDYVTCVMKRHRPASAGRTLQYGPGKRKQLVVSLCARLPSHWVNVNIILERRKYTTYQSLAVCLCCSQLSVTARGGWEGTYKN